VTATVCVGILGVATIGGTTAASARLDESLLTKQGASVIQNELESLKTAGRMATLTPRLATREVTLGPNSVGTLTTDVRGDIPPQLAAYLIEGLDGEPGSISAQDTTEAHTMILRSFGNNDLTQCLSSTKLNSAGGFDIYFSEPLNDTNSGADLVPELIFSSMASACDVTVQALDSEGELIGVPFAVATGFTSSTPTGYVSDGRSKTFEVGILGLDLSETFEVQNVAGVRILLKTKFTSFKVIGLNGADVNSTVAPTYEVSGPGTTANTAGALMLNGLKFGSESNSHFIYPSRVENLSLDAPLGRLRFLNRPSTVYDVLIKLEFEARSIVGPKPREINVESAVQYGSVYF